MRGRSTTDGRALALGVALLVGLAGCRPEPAEVREARPLLRDFATALRSRDEVRLRDLATCVVETAGVLDARLRYLEPLGDVRRAALDSLATLYRDAQRIADSLYTAAPDSAADLESRFDRTRSLARRAAATRAAVHAAERSGSASSVASRDAGRETLRTLRAHLLVRYGGESVGPTPIERDTIVRMIRAPGGGWVIYAFDLASDAPGPLPY
ncbi:MAG TPA: hypothetical protein VFS09_02430 [Candidatus Eisenbacteria bacterium]|nr:hypothetical protein [Candidatus Eisenbacteria bacterium]